MNSIAGIVLFNPDIKRLKENVNAISSQVDEIVFVDNHSDNISSIKGEFSGEQFLFVENNDNLGIAKALNQICEYAQRLGYCWVLTLDQDSVACQNIISAYNKYITEDGIGLLTCKIIDRNFIEDEPDTNETYVVNTAITSGSYVSIDAWKKSGGFDERMFIDFVDNDFCTSLLENHYKILKVNSVNILHELGHSRKLKFLKGQIIYNHSAFRYYHLTRNRIYYARKHRKSVSFLRNILAVSWRALLILVFESNKQDNLQAIIKGYKDGFRMKIYE